MILRTLGGLALEGRTLSRPKPLLLLSYLALEGVKSRRHLAELFFPGTANALNSLSRTLTIIRGDAPDVLLADDQQVAAVLACDAVNLLEQLESQHLAEAVAAYTGPFLQSFALLGLSAELENWVYGTREYLGKLVREALLRLGEQEALLGRHEAATGFAERAYRLPGAAGLEFEDFPRLYRLLQGGQSFQAAEVRREAHDLGIDLRGQSSLSPAPRLAPAPGGLPHHNLPTFKTSFINRERELAHISKQLEGEDCALLTLHGPGGVGKSRLALQAAKVLLQERTFESAIQLDLAMLTSAEHIPAGLAEALDLTLQGQRDPLSQVASHLADRRCLLLLDNFEQLMVGVFVPAALIAACPNVSVLVTSRERLNLKEEWVYQVRGLRTPKPALSLEEAQAADAVTLFVQRARRTRLDFRLTQEALPAVLKICRLVEGFPLALELAATWVRLLSCAAIAEELAQSLKLLSTETRNVPERQRSITAVLDQSWQRLSDEERRVLRTLAVFRGGFRKEAAQEVVGATLPLLAALIDKALLSTGPTGRFDRHVMLYHYTLERLAETPDEQSAAEAAHAAYYHALLSRLETELHGDAPQAATQTIEEELSNLQLAWRWAARQGKGDALERAVIPLRVFFDRQGRFQEGLDFFESVRRALDEKEHPAALGTLLVEQGWLHFRRGDHDAARQAATQGLNMLRPLEAWRGVVEALHVLGALKFYSGALVQARQDWAEALSLVQLQGDHEAHARTLDYLGVVEEHLGNYDEAYRSHRDSLELCRKLGNKARMVQVLNNSGALAILMGQADEADTLLSEGLDLAHEVSERRAIPYLLNNLARAALIRADYEKTGNLGREALTLAREMGESLLEAKVFVETLGPLALALGKTAEARATFLQCLSLTQKMKAAHVSLQALLGFAEVLEESGEPQRAVFLLGIILNHGSASPLTEREARARLEEIGKDLAEDLLRDALERAKTTELGTVINRLFDENGKATSWKF